MKVELTEVIWLEEHEFLTEAQLVEASGLTGVELKELTEYGVLEPTPSSTDRATFSPNAITVAQTARRLRRDFGLSADGLAIAIQLLDRIRSLEAELTQLRAQLPGKME